MTGELPLVGVRVLELGHIVAGPSAGLILADLGADVIKVERSGESDQSRTMPAGTSALFHFLNRNKRSIAIDLKGSAEGRALFLRLAAASEPHQQPAVAKLQVGEVGAQHQGQAKRTLRCGEVALGYGE